MNIDDQMLDNFKEKVDIKYLVDGTPDYEKCWIWKGYVNNGCGVFNYNDKKYQARRVAYELSTGQPLEKGEYVHYNCPDGLCGNPKHLYIGVANLKDVQKKRQMLGISNSPVPDKDIDRFLSKIDIKYLANGQLDYNQCWEWNAGCNNDGYGKFQYQNKSISAHRFMYMLIYGEIPDGMCVCHTCDEPSCVDPKHLFLGTAKENNQDRDKKKRQAKGEQTNSTVLKNTDVIEILTKIQGNNPAYQSVADIAEQYGVSDSTIRCILNGKSWKYITKEFPLDVLRKKVKCNQIGINNPGSKLSELQITEILTNIQENDPHYQSITDIAKQYNVTYGTIYDILSGKTWRHITKNFPLDNLRKKVVKSDRSGVNGASSKLSESQVRQIRIDINNGITNTAIAKVNDVAPITIYNIKNKKTYTNVI